MRLILGSQSPRRKEILSYFNIPFEQVSSSFDEDSLPFQDDPEAYVKALAIAKAQVLHPHYPHSLILTADTTVYAEGKIFGKPKTSEEGFQNLSELAGKWHSVFTAVAIKNDKELFVEVEETRVLFNPLTPSQIRRYQEALHCADKAGGYAVQQGGSIIVKKMEGCFYNVMGLPINALHKVLNSVGVDLWNFLKPSPFY